MNLEDLKKINKQIVDEVYPSTFYYGNLTEEQHLRILTRLLDQATERGWISAGGKKPKKLTFFFDNI